MSNLGICPLLKMEINFLSMHSMQRFIRFYEEYAPYLGIFNDGYNDSSNNKISIIHIKLMEIKNVQDRM